MGIEEHKKIGDYIFYKNTIGENVLLIYDGKNEIVTIPPFINKVGMNSFALNQTVKEVIIPDGVTLEVGAFQKNKTIEKVTLPNDLEKIELCAFDGCSALKEVILPSNLKDIEALAFNRCENLEKLEIREPLSNVRIAENAFAETPFEDKFSNKSEKVKVTDEIAKEVDEFNKLADEIEKDLENDNVDDDDIDDLFDDSAD